MANESACLQMLTATELLSRSEFRQDLPGNEVSTIRVSEWDQEVPWCPMGARSRGWY